jgi:hypothetical protein
VERNVDEERGIDEEGETGGVERKNGKEEENGGRSWRTRLEEVSGLDEEEARALNEAVVSVLDHCRSPQSRRHRTPLLP